MLIERAARRLARFVATLLVPRVLPQLLPLIAAAALGAPVARAQAVLACTADPFTPQALSDRDASLARRCAGEQLRWQVEPQDPAAAVRRSGVLRSRLDSVACEPLAPGLTGAVKLSWAALGGEPAVGLRTERTLLSAGGLMRLGDDWALQMNAGRDLTTAARRATMGGAWRPAGVGLVFAEWMGDDRGAEARRLGARWWLLPKRLLLELDARHDTGTSDLRRYGLLLQLQP